MKTHSVFFVVSLYVENAMALTFPAQLVPSRSSQRWPDDEDAAS
jgi:hypothetical protein